MKQETHVPCSTADCTEGLRRSMVEELVMLAPRYRIRRDPTLEWLRNAGDLDIYAFARSN
jgi:hypothetical protein